ncbi:hypothetical protein GF380_04720 [Candidatus Uhrbacteria bacterium]|nr:hypothetical protein [Candidatus Uhrbacteria bacterium]MBD3284357.1 hypothetical protein [Candidatus Uhrbacteria bacterium]
MIRTLLITLAVSLMYISAVSAHTIAYSVFDFEQTDDGIELVVGLQPELALTVLGLGHTALTTLEPFDQKMELIGAYVESNVRLTQQGERCVWQTTTDPLRDSLIEQQAEGITVRGLIRCPHSEQPFDIQTDLFVDAHANQKNLLRYRDGEQFVAFAELDRFQDSATVDLRETFTETRRSHPEYRVRQIVLNGLIALTLVLGLGWVLLHVRKRIKKRQDEWRE